MKDEQQSVSGGEAGTVAPLREAPERVWLDREDMQKPPPDFTDGFRWLWSTTEPDKASASADVKYVRADLAAAAPLMLEALRRIVGMCDVGPRCTCGRPNGLPAVIACARAAIQSATAPTKEG